MTILLQIFIQYSSIKEISCYNRSPKGAVEKEFDDKCKSIVNDSLEILEME
ncbi:MAG: hypothetical protein ACOCV8_00070 [Spirochaetota bacterium]